MNNLSSVAVLAVIAAAVLLMWLARKRDGLVVLPKRFAAEIDPGGPYTACKIRFVPAEMSTPCIVRATQAGWYMVSPQEEVAKWRWSNNVAYLREPVFIPWSMLDYAPAKFPMHRWMRFDVVGTKVVFFVRKDMALALLPEGARPLVKAPC